MARASVSRRAGCGGAGRAAARAPGSLLEPPRIGEKLDAYAPRDARRIIVGNCELRYEIADATIYILRPSQCRVNRCFESGE